MTDGARRLPWARTAMPHWTDEARWLGAALATVAIVTIGSFLAAALVPGLRPMLLREDGIVEMATALALAVAVIGAVSALWKQGLHLPLLIAAAIGFAELMDETSFGARLFGFAPPPLYGGGELDGFHDLLILAYRLLDGASPYLAWTLVGLILAGSLACLALALKAIWRSARGIGSWLAAHALLLLHFGLVGLAQAIDVAAHSAMLSAAEEVLELNAALVLVFYVARQARAHAADGPRRPGRQGLRTSH